MRKPKSHRIRFSNWRKLGGKPLMTMASLVEQRLVEPLLQDGFEWTDVYLRDPDFPNNGNEIVLERGTGGEIAVIIFNFDKYHRPAFEMHLARREAQPPYAFIHSASLVRRTSQYFHFWGKPWWLPVRFWTEGMSERAVARLAGKLDQALAFVERGECGPNIGRLVHMVQRTTNAS
ncbi:hypothetical protein GCM10007973_30040 [Polymorphobacter multimanifer]|uniref:Uncharacterized protein n=1 Tax=Polymorphobacter multimanifer TaxID=1070431 RepID=A0A841L4L0_9SPHN|nr:hypothetical protein [Polymorphobacter multimanifer]MBB6227789.1 hypothetical protein [Polymorphobacter multimanifer]GGI91767.1 hypothetical protein GCM10007973_30040 [Polymorphobacter multimanifer]